MISPSNLPRTSSLHSSSLRFKSIVATAAMVLQTLLRRRAKAANAGKRYDQLSQDGLNGTGHDDCTVFIHSRLQRSGERREKKTRGTKRKGLGSIFNRDHPLSSCDCICCYTKMPENDPISCNLAISTGESRCAASLVLSLSVCSRDAAACTMAAHPNPRFMRS